MPAVLSSTTCTAILSNHKHMQVAAWMAPKPMVTMQGRVLMATQRHTVDLWMGPLATLSGSGGRGAAPPTLSIGMNLLFMSFLRGCLLSFMYALMPCCSSAR